MTVAASGGACSPARYRWIPWTAVTRSRKVLVTSSGVKTAVVGAAEVTGAGDVGEPAVVMVNGADGVGEPAVVIGAVMMMGSGGVGVDEDMIEPESLDTKLVGTRALLDLGRRL